MQKEKEKEDQKNQEQFIVCYHGQLDSKYQWKQPILVAKSQQLARKGYSNIKANQFADSSAVLAQKVKLLAAIIKQSKNLVIYTGAGISRASGIADYASKAKNTRAGNQNQSLNRLNAEPTQAHYILTQMEKKGYIKHWVQQNHDGLAQKAGFPMSKLNQIHGSWFDKKNPVVLMDDKLNSKNFKELQQWQQKVDVCIAIGTSLCGMRSDGIAKQAGKKGGLIIINLQQTPYDKYSALRLYGNLQQIIKDLGKQLGIKVKQRLCITNPYQWNK